MTVNANTSPAVRDDDVIDLEAAVARLEGDRAFFCELAEMFVNDEPARLAAIETALVEEALTEVARLAHSLRGSAGPFAAAATTAAAQQLEAAAGRDDLAQARCAFGQLKRAAERLIERLRTILNQQ